MSEASSKITPGAPHDADQAVVHAQVPTSGLEAVEQSTRHVSKIKRPPPAVPHWKTRLPFYKSLFLMMVPLMLDIQDIIYKLHIIGPSETYSFETKVGGVLRDDELVPQNPNYKQPQPGDAIDSGWPSFLATCESLRAFDGGGGFFVNALGTNCTLGKGQAEHLEPSIIISTGVRLDSIVWTSCKLLFQHRQPSICQGPIVTRFLERYMLDDFDIPLEELAEPDSDAEKELLALLDMVSQSHPDYKIVCAEGLYWTNQELSDVKQHDTHIHGCASPNMFRSEFVGISNPKFGDYHRRRVWLTADVFEVFGVHFRIRQNNKNHYIMRREADGGITATGHITPNFSCFGPLYILMLTLDVTLIFIYIRASIEVLRCVVVPQSEELQRRRIAAGEAKPGKSMNGIYEFVEWATRQTSSGRSAPQMSGFSTIPSDTILLGADFRIMGEDDLESPVPCSLYRSWPVILAVLTTQSLSWLIVMPNSVVWVWGLSLTTKIQAYLCSLRVWVLLLISVNFIWDCIVRLNERVAYFVSSRTYVTIFEIMGIGGIVALWKRFEVFSMCEIKWGYERQRANDVTAFQGGYIAHANTFREMLDEFHSTPMQTLWVVYGPLFRILGFSVLFIFTYAALKGLVLHLIATSTNTRLKETISRYISLDILNHFHGKEQFPYMRLPLEEMLDSPIRASCLVRNRMSMEIMSNRQRLIRPSCYIDFGILPRDGYIEGRTGFISVVKPAVEQTITAKKNNIVEKGLRLTMGKAGE